MAIYLVRDDGRLQPDESFYCQTDEEAAGKLRPPPFAPTSAPSFGKAGAWLRSRVQCAGCPS